MREKQHIRGNAEENTVEFKKETRFTCMGV